MLNNTKLRHFWAQIVSWAPRHARKTFIVLALGLTNLAKHVQLLGIGIIEDGHGSTHFLEIVAMSRYKCLLNELPKPFSPKHLYPQCNVPATLNNVTSNYVILIIPYSQQNLQKCRAQTDLLLPPGALNHTYKSSISEKMMPKGAILAPFRIWFYMVWLYRIN